MTDQQILDKIKSVVLEEIPEAKIYLFGSRTSGKIHSESDWDLLVLTENDLSKNVKKDIEEKLFPLSMAVSSVFSFIITTRKDWNHNPGYYALHLGIGDQFITL